MFNFGGLGISFLGCRDGGYTTLMKGSSIAVSRLARGADDERRSSREGGAVDGDEGCTGVPDGVFRLSDRPIRKFDMSVVRKLD